jgi:Immunoglobulin-like domain of bacterial spore germination
MKHAVASALLVLTACASSARPVAPSMVTTAGRRDIIVVEAPAMGDVLQSPMLVRGRARGMWFFEGDFPVKLVDARGKVLAQVPARAQGEWMTEQYVPFEATVPFDPQGATEGTLILQKNNASGLPEHDDELRVPVKFE